MKKTSKNTSLENGAKKTTAKQAASKLDVMAQAEKKAKEERISRKKSDLTVNIIRYNHITEKLIEQMLEGLREMLSISGTFNGQRDLMSRSRMQERILNTALKMISQNKMQLWMIDDNSLEAE